jgi:hypothetical protein
MHRYHAKITVRHLNVDQLLLGQCEGKSEENISPLSYEHCVRHQCLLYIFT